jgi:inosine/xanthosine triphosphate pyrophosphatase family protein
MSIKKHLAIITHSNSGKVAEIRANLKKLGIDVPKDLRSRVALESIAIAKSAVTKATDELPRRD